MRAVTLVPQHPRPRNTAAIIITRSDGPLGAPAHPESSAELAQRSRRAAQVHALRRWRRLGALATWTVLGLLIAALWALLLLGDSLAPVAQ